MTVKLAHHHSGFFSGKLGETHVVFKITKVMPIVPKFRGKYVHDYIKCFDNSVQLFFAFEYFQHSLHSHRKAFGRVGIAGINKLIENITMAMATLHASMLVHCDISAHNIVIVGDMVFKLASYDNIQRTGQSKLMSSIDKSNIHFPPETLFAAEYSERSDVWLFGVVLYEYMTGRRLIDATTIAANMHDDISRKIRFAPKSTILENMLKTSVAERCWPSGILNLHSRKRKNIG